MKCLLIISYIGLILINAWYLFFGGWMLYNLWALTPWDQISEFLAKGIVITFVAFGLSYFFSTIGEFATSNKDQD